MNERTFIVSKEDWSLHRKGHQDQLRHKQKVNEAIRQNLPDLLTEENIVISGGKQVVKVPIRSLDEYRFRFNHQKSKHVGQGDGDSVVGDVLGVDPTPASSAGKGEGAGDQAGDDVYEAEIQLNDIEDILFAELELPNLQRKENGQFVIKDIRFNDIRNKGMISNLDKKRTILENMRRNALNHNPGIGRISPDDLRYKTWEDIIKPESNAVILAIMDTSGSMGTFEKYVARSFYFWMIRFLRRKYERVEIVFIAHHTEAKEVSEQDFFHRGESGGTICSSAYRKALEIIDERYPPSRFNIYPFHFSDGDNLSSDNDRCLKLLEELLEVTNLFGYGEINQYNRNSTLMSAYRGLQHPNFRTCLIREKNEVYAALKSFFSNMEGAVEL
ncbi:MAG: sporulation protein YhbH [Paenibacillaceae bacterium]